jgi:phosphoserine phosphatase
MKGQWVRKPEGNVSVVFVHGILSSGESCWLNKNGTYWPDLLAKEMDLQSVGAYVFTYETGVFSGSYRLGDAVDALKEFMRLDRVTESKYLIFVCHSMGGILVRKYLVERAMDLTRGKHAIDLFLVASPSLGSSYADWLSPLAQLFGHAQADALAFVRGNAWLSDLDKEFMNLKEAGDLSIRGKELVEDKFVVLKQFFGQQVVEPFSGARYFGEPFKVPMSDHFSIAKPENKEAIQHRLLCQFISDTLERTRRPAVESTVQAAPETTPPPIAPPAPKLIDRYATPLAARPRPKPSSTKGYRVVAFDLDGTLLRGMQFSWTVVWKSLNFPEAVYRGAMRDYRKGKTTYQEWCDLACNQFRARGLRRSAFTAIASGVTVTNNLRETLTILRTTGMVLALVSGGMDTFVEEKIPDAAELFDYICINRIRFEQPGGLISGVEATPFDFEGKVDAVEAICQRHGCSLAEAVFVGEGFNDEQVVNRVGLGIAYPPGETAIEAASISIAEDDLSKILEHIL